MRRRIEVGIAICVRALALFFPVVVAAGVARGGAASFVGVFVVFGLLGFVEIFLHLTGIGTWVRVPEEDVAVLRRWPRFQLWTYGLLHVAVHVFVLARLSRLGALEIVGAGLSLASMAGTVGGLGAHDLIHKRSRWDRALGTLMYSMSSYGHFPTSHLGGHHVDVGRHHDWGTARRGESIYHFLWRAMVHGFAGGVRIEATRRRAIGRHPYLGNFVVTYAALTVLGWVLLVAFAGFQALVFVIAASIASISFMEMFNYISHYGLERGGDAIHVRHTWESANKIVNWFIFNAGLHKHHHRKPTHGFERLAAEGDGDHIPHGIALMALLTFVPPLYIGRMETLLAEKRERDLAALRIPRSRGP